MYIRSTTRYINVPRYFVHVLLGAHIDLGLASVVFLWAGDLLLTCRYRCVRTVVVHGAV